MTLAEVRTTYSWQATMELAPKLVTLAESLPSQEQAGLVSLLQHLMVDLPGAVAEDLIHGSEHRFGVAMRLSAAVEVIDKVYPALDTLSVRQAVDELVERLDGSNFAEQVPTTAVTPEVDEAEPTSESVSEPTAEPAAAIPAEPASEATSDTAPTFTPPIIVESPAAATEPMITPASQPAAPVDVAVTPTVVPLPESPQSETVHVQPNSLQ
jgi:hypothetical protein